MLQQIVLYVGTLGTTVYTADHAKHQPIAVVTLKVKDNAPDGAQAINLTTFNGVDANLDKVGATMNSTSVTIGGAVVPTATAVPVPTATTAPVENYIATLNVTNGSRYSYKCKRRGLSDSCPGNRSSCSNRCTYRYRRTGCY